MRNIGLIIAALFLCYHNNTFGQKVDSLTNIHLIIKGTWLEDHVYQRNKTIRKTYEVKREELLKMDTLKLTTDSLIVCSFEFQPLVNGADIWMISKSETLTNEMKKVIINQKIKKITIESIKAVSKNTGKMYFIKSIVSLNIKN
ncbi:MAG: hypothetical protein WAQ28_07870 [Bacteroidia bacterium]|jgi:hypothetical protein